MHNTDTKTPSSFLTLTVGIFIGAMLVLPMFAYMCRVNWQLRQENQRMRVQVVKQQVGHLPPEGFIFCPADDIPVEFRSKPFSTLSSQRRADIKIHLREAPFQTQLR